MNRPAFIAELLEAAEKSTRGRWEVSDKVLRLNQDRYMTIISPGIRHISYVLEGYEKSEEDAAHIALSCPDNTIELAKYIEELEAENFKLAAGVCHDCLTDEYGNLRCGLAEENKKLKEALTKIANLAPVLLPQQLVDRFIDVRLIAKTALTKNVHQIDGVTAEQLERAASLGEKP